jgi:hypothetical protein
MKPLPATSRRQLPEAGTVATLDRRRIERALAQRTRYRYVQPRVIGRGEEGDLGGWVVVSPNCSRSIDREGGDIGIAWFQPIQGQPARWRLHRRDHAGSCWVVHSEGVNLEQALAHVCSDPLGVWWP